jgi:triosephosphate isomerase
MNGVKSSAKILTEIHAGYTPGLKAKVDLAICPPATLVSLFAYASVFRPRCSPMPVPLM